MIGRLIDIHTGSAAIRMGSELLGSGFMVLALARRTMSEPPQDDGHGRNAPPRAWGRPQHDPAHDHEGRNTPTRVGKTRSGVAAWGVA
jgi:hypothetical protein